MKKLIISLFILTLLTSISYAIDKDSAIINGLGEEVKGRSVIYDEPELVTIWYHGGAHQGAFGISGTTATSNGAIGGLYMTLYEDGQPLDDAAGLRFESAYETITMMQSVETANTVQGLVDYINSDSSGYFKAAIGRDATPGTTVIHAKTADINYLSNDEEKAKTNGDVIKDDTSAHFVMLCGQDPEPEITYRLKRFEETVEGTGAHMIKVWEGSTCVWRRGYASSDQYSGTGDVLTTAFYEGVTPLTVTFNDKGLCGTKGKGMVVSSEWTTAAGGDSEQTENISIEIGHWKD